MDGDVTFNFTANDTMDITMTCNLTVDGGVVDPNFAASNGSIIDRTINGLTDGAHYWNVTCWDNALNVNSSSTQP